MPGLISRANLTVRITVKNTTPLEREKYGKIDFAPSKRSDIGQNTTKLMGTHAEVNTELFRTILYSNSASTFSLRFHADMRI